jgi:hypothetical protein
MDEKMIEQLEAEESTFVQTAHGITSDGATLTLEGVTHRRCTFPIAHNVSSGA